MRLKRSVLFTSAALLIAMLLALGFVPLIVAGGLRIWAQRAAQREGLQVEFGEIEAPFLRPVVMRNVRVQSDPKMPFQIEGTAARVELGLNLAAIFTTSKRPLRHLEIDGLNFVMRRKGGEPMSSHRAPWSILKNLQADRFKFSAVDLHIENGLTTVDVRDGALTGSEMEAGTLTAREISLVSPWFQKTLSNMRGATSWQDNKLALGALSLMRGFDIDTMAIDLSQIGESRIGMEVNVDAFGGKLRARISSDDRGGKRTWDVAGNGSGVSLAQMSDALEWENRASGVVHASKFTFRGEINDLRNATAAIWAEISGLTWRDRAADTVMIGASLYNREVQVEQLYIKQRNNQLTLSGEFGWPEKLGDEIRPAFRGDLSASINDLGEFARLFGWSPPDFAGQLSASGSVTAREGKFGGHLSVTGNTLVLFRSPIESLEMKLDLEESRVTVTQFELRQTGDFFHGEGNFALTGDYAYSGAFQTSVAELANYRGFIPKTIVPLPLQGSINAEWKGRGANGVGSGSFQARAQNLRAAEGAFVPFNVELAADYSPEDIFFRQFHFWNQRAELNAFVGVGKSYIQVQELRAELDGHPRLTGNVFLPISAGKLRENFSWLAALGTEPFLDVDLTLDSLDLAEVAAAVKTKPDLSGRANGRLQLSGMPGSLQGKTQVQLRDFVFDNAPALTANLDASLAFGMVNLKSDLVVRGSNPVTVDAVVPIQLEKQGGEFALVSNGPLSAAVNFPAVFLAKLPAYVSRGSFTRGILSGSVNLSDSVQQPTVTGSANLVDGELLGGPEISGGIIFAGTDATLNYAHWKERDVDISARGKIEFNNFTHIHLALWPNVALTPMAALRAEDCVSAVAFHASPSVSRLTGAVNQIDLEGTLSGAGWIVSLSQQPPNGDGDNEALLPQTFPLCRDGKTLSLGLVPALFP
jgi:hypothetical protein